MAATRSALLGTLLACGACTTISVRTTTYLADDIPFPANPPAVRVYVLTDSVPKEPLLEREVGKKITHLLTKQGYQMGIAANCTHVLHATIGIDAGKSRVYSYPVRHRGVTTYQTTSEYEYTRTLILTMYDADRWSQLAEDDKDYAISWSATTHSTGGSSDLREMIDYLLVETFEFLGTDTGREIRRTLTPGDPRVKELRGSNRP